MAPNPAIDPWKENMMSEVRSVAEVNGVKEYRYFADGEWRTAESRKLFDVYKPYDRSLYARVAAGGRAEAKLAVDAAAKAFPAWSQTTPAERAKLFFKAAAPRSRRFWPSRRAAPSRSPPSSRTWWPPPSSRRLGGCTCPRAKSWNPTSPARTPSACVGRWA
jgi:hypothetical protein